MDIIEQLIKSLQEAKAELEKNMNCAPGSDPNMGKMEEPHKDDPKHEEKEKKAASKIKSEAEDILDMHKEELMCSANGQWSLKKAKIDSTLSPEAKVAARSARNNRVEHDSAGKDGMVNMKTIGTPKPASPVGIATNLPKPLRRFLRKEEEMEKDAANPALAPKEVKIKELQSKIDAGKYKVPASKIADKMVKEEAE